MNKGDRYVSVHLNPRTQTAILFPYVCFMGGCGRGFGDARELKQANPLTLGDCLVEMLEHCKEADISAMQERHMSLLRRYWQGEDDAFKNEGVNIPSWTRLWRIYRALTKGPATILRQFSVCDVIENDHMKNRRIERTERSDHPGGTKPGESIRIPVGTSALHLGEVVLDFLRRNPSNSQ